MGLTWFDAATATLIAMLEERLRFETLLSDLSAKLIHVAAGGLDAALEGALRQMITFLGVDRGNLDEYSEGRPGVRVCWAEPDVETLPSILEAGQFPWTAGTLRRGGVVRFPRTDALPEEAATDRASYERLGTRSHLSIPLQAGGPMLGVLSFDSVRAERDWPDELIDRLALLSEAFAGALERKRMELALAERLRFQRLLSDLSVRFANVPALDFDQAVHGALRAIVDSLGVDRAALIAFPTRGAAGAAWSFDGAADMSNVPGLVIRLQAGEVVRIARPEQLPDGITSMVAVPLRAAGAVLGGLLVATVGAQGAWPDELMEQLHLVGETVANALASAQAEREAGRLRQELAHIGRVSAMGELNGQARALVIRTGRAGDEAVRVAVEDAGVGIDTDDLERLFQPLYTTKPEGLGMGLAIARTIIEAHGGHLRGSNNAAGGATFQFTLPVAGGPSR